MVVIGHEMYRLMVGMDICPYQNPSRMSQWIYDLDDWFSFLHDFLEENDLTVTLPATPYLKHKCVRDRSLMDLMNDCLMRAEVHSFNRCWLFLRATHVSNISSGDGKQLLWEAYQGTKRLETYLQWPDQHSPSLRDWNVWRRVLCEEVLSSTQTLSLRIFLGSWYDEPSAHHYNWQLYFHPSSHELIRATRQDGKASMPGCLAERD